jgi:transcriptional regulator with PAS, ATPase and Fis domain
MQVKLLRVLQEKKFVPIGGNREVKTNARIIAATNRNLEKMIADSDFREDLFYRLSVMPIFLPPLRERPDDIPALVQHFIKSFAKTMDSPIQGITPDALELLKNYRWPGNIRELENCIERAFIVENSPMIEIDSLPESIRNSVQQVTASHVATTTAANRANAGASAGTTTTPSSSASALDYEAYKEQAEKDFVVQALRANKGKINQTVAQAGIPKNTLLRKIKKYQINVDDFK